MRHTFRSVIISISLWLSLCLVARAEEIARSILDYQTRQLEAVSGLLSRSEGFFAECVRSTTVANKDGKEHLMDTNFIARQSELACSVKTFPGGSVYAYISNDRYCTLLTANLRKNVALQSWTEVADLRKSPFAMSHFSKLDPNWIKDIQRREMFGTYFSFGGPMFLSQFPNWVQTQTMTHDSISADESLKEVVFPDWLPDKSSLKLTTDHEGCVYKAEVQIGRVHSILVVDEFVTVDGVRLPKKLSVVDKNVDDPTRLSRSTLKWEECSAKKANMKGEQFYSSYYGLSEPDFDKLPPNPHNYLSVSIFSTIVALVLVGIIFVARKYAY